MKLLNTRESFIVAPESIRPGFDDPGLMGLANDERLVTLILADPPNSRNMEPQMCSKFLQISDDLLDHPTVDALSDRDFRVLIRLLRMLRHGDDKKDDHGQEICLKKGQLMFTFRNLSEVLEIPKTSLENLLNKLEKVGILGQDLGHVKSILTLSEKYVIKKPGTESGTSLGQDWDTKIYSNTNTSSSSKPDEPKKTKTRKPSEPKAYKPKEPKPETTAAELELKKQRKITMDVAHKIGFPLAPAEINALIKKYSLEAVRFVINLYASEGFKDTKPDIIKAAIYKRIQSEHAYNEEFNDNDRDPYAA